MVIDVYSNDAKPQYETTIRNYDTKPQYKTSTRNVNKNLLYFSIITTTPYEAAKNAIVILKIYYKNDSEKI